MNYKIVEEEDYALAAVVREWIEKGWRPLGGVSVVRDGFGNRAYQAMIKES